MFIVFLHCPKNKLHGADATVYAWPMLYMAMLYRNHKYRTPLLQPWQALFWQSFILCLEQCTYDEVIWWGRNRPYSKRQCLHFFFFFCLRGTFPSLPGDFLHSYHNDPAAKDNVYIFFFFASGVRFPLYPEIFYIITQWSCRKRQCLHYVYSNVRPAAG